MPIPCYFADIWSDFVKKCDFSYAQLGNGLQEDGSARISRTQVGALCVIDDSVLCMPKESALDDLAALCARGCCLDFERPFTKAHAALILGLRKRVKGFFALPSRFLSYAPNAVPIVSCPRPCNSWRSYVMNVHRRFPNGWMLELTPWKHVSPGRMKQSEGFLSGAVCEFRCENGITQYYDTKKSLREKIRIAEQYACRAAIGLYQEWEVLPI